MGRKKQKSCAHIDQNQGKRKLKSAARLIDRSFEQTLYLDLFGRTLPVPATEVFVHGKLGPLIVLQTKIVGRKNDVPRLGLVMSAFDTHIKRAASAMEDAVVNL